jgi:hypothetical protein
VHSNLAAPHLDKGQTFGCKDSQVLHLNICYNKYEISKDFSFITFNQLFGKKYLKEIAHQIKKITGFIYLNSANFLQIKNYGWN